MLQAGATVINYITANGAVEVNYSTAGRQQGFSLATGKSSKISVSYRAATVKSESAASIAAVCLGNNTVLAAVVIVVKHRACLSVSQLIVGI